MDDAKERLVRIKWGLIEGGKAGRVLGNASQMKEGYSWPELNDDWLLVMTMHQGQKVFLPYHIIQVLYPPVGRQPKDSPAQKILDPSAPIQAYATSFGIPPGYLIFNKRRGGTAGKIYNFTQWPHAGGIKRGA
jgi:hypothetical protein